MTSRGLGGWRDAIPRRVRENASAKHTSSYQKWTEAPSTGSDSNDSDPSDPSLAPARFEGVESSLVAECTPPPMHVASHAERVIRIRGDV